MAFNFIDTGGTVSTSQLCLYDSNIGYEADFSVDGDVAGWTMYNGIHTYGCWNNFLFGTLYGDTSTIGRHNVFRTVEAEQFYTVKIVMKLNIKERVGTQNVPEYGRMAWTTESDPSWGSSKEFDFIINTDNKWHTYNLNMGEVQWWQGDINNLRLYPILQDGRDGDEFFVRVIKILSINTYKCNNTSCDYFSEYQHPCVGVGERGTCTSKSLEMVVQGGTVFDFAVDKKYTITEGVNDEFLVNINEYGYESIKLPVTSNVSGTEMAKIIAKEISKINVGGYSEVFVEYNNKGQFIIYSGTYVSDSVVKIGNSPAAVTLNFYDEFGKYQSDESIGQPPVSGYRPLSSFRMNTNQVLNLFSDVENVGFFFNPFIYNIEGGRRDWLDFGLGVPSKDVRGQEDDDTGVMNRYYDMIDNADKTIIDFTHPFNASGRITKIYLAVTLDNYGSSYDARGDYDADRINTQLENAKVMFFRPLKDGTLKVLSQTVSIENRDHTSGNLYSITQEYVEIDCDVFVNKGDLIGVYNANIYKGRSVSGSETDALFYQVSGKASGVLDVHTPSGEGSSGLLFYARSDQIQNRLMMEIDLSKRINIDSVDIIGAAVDEKLEYNVARCLDINWSVDLFDGNHSTGWVIQNRPYVEGIYNHPNIYYGKDCLTDGIKTAPDGLAGTSFSVDLQTYYRTDEYSYPSASHIQVGGNGIVIQGAKYFQVNGDSEWLAHYLLAGRQSPFAKDDFKRDPMAFTLLFPYGKKKKLSRLKIYFKERYNFRSFALSFFKGDSYQGGTADMSTFDLIPYRIDGTETPWSKLVLDGLDYIPENKTEWSAVDLYLAHNPVVGHELLEANSIQIGNYDSVLAYYGGSQDYEEHGTIINNDQLTQARSVDWTTLSIEWPESNELGFRLYCDYHESTKICEMELFCTVDDVGSSMAGSVSVIYSSYGETLWLSDTSQDIDGNVKAFIGDTPRYITVEITPITEIELRNININVGEGDFFLGEKGCQSETLPVISKTDNVNDAVPIIFKNIYDGIYDLYVDIVKDTRVEEGLVFYSRLNNQDSITNPEVGADSYYKKEPNYSIKNDNYNVAINCPVYGMKNLVDGAEVWYSYKDGGSWNYWGTFFDTTSADFSNLPDASMTVFNVPVLKRSKWWKVGFLDSGVSMNVREIGVYYNGEEITGVKFYHHKNQSYILGGNIDEAPHLNNNVIEGSYYVLSDNQYIGIELPGCQEIDQIVLYHDFLEAYENTIDVAGIDSSTVLCLTGYGDLYQTDTITDYSYYEHELEVVGSGIYCDDREYQTHAYSFVEDFSNCPSIVDWVVVNDHSSTFTCSSGISGEDWVYEFDVGVCNYSNDCGCKKPVIYDIQYFPIDQDWAFEFNFKFNLEYSHDVYGNDSSDTGVSVGVLHSHRWKLRGGVWLNYYEPYFEGAQMLFADNKFGIAVQGHWSEGTIPAPGDGYTTTTGVVYDTTYYCTLSSDGKGDYSAKAWTDGWEGAVQVCDLNKSSDIKWNADKIGVGSGWGSYVTDPLHRSKGWAADFDFSGELIHKHNVFGGSGIKFNGNEDEHIKIDYDNNTNCNVDSHVFDLKDKRFTFDTFIKFNLLPSDGEQYVLASCWEAGSVISEGSYAGSSWAFVVENVSGTIKLRFYSVKDEVSLLVFDYTWNPDQYRWYHIRLSRGKTEHWWPGSYVELFINGRLMYVKEGLDAYSSIWVPIDTNEIDVIIGENFNGWLQEFRISSDYSKGGERVYYYFGTDYPSDREFTDHGIPTKPFERYYTFSLYISDDNNYYGHYANIDSVFSNSYSYYDSINYFSSGYYTYFALDLGHRYSLDIVRSFPVDESHAFSLTDSVVYSKINTSNPLEAFGSFGISDINTGFNGIDKDLPDNWYITDGGTENYIVNNKLYQSSMGGYVALRSGFYLFDSFDFEIEYELLNIHNINSWFCGIQIIDVDNSNNQLSFERGFYSGANYYRLRVLDNDPNWVIASMANSTHISASIKITRDGQTFKMYSKDLDVFVPEDYTLVGVYEMENGFGREVTLNIISQSDTPYYPSVTVEWDNLIFNAANPVDSSYSDARWLKIRMWNGDGTTRTIKRIGVYPDISVQTSPDYNYNTEWVSLGSSVTSYVGEENVATNADVETSSYVGVMVPENAVNGLLTSELQQSWGSERGVPQWITVKLPQEMQIYRIKLHPGYDDSDTDHLIQDYTVQTSDDNETFNTIFTITGNTSFSRTHDLIIPVTTSYIRIYITAYKYKRTYVKTLNGYTYWEGASLRQIEIYKYYGNTIISSEDHPIIALDLKQNYFIRGHSMVGVDAENPDIDWSNDDSNYTYSNSDLSDPKKVTFGEWGEVPNYEKWVVIKRNTATHYPLVPDEYYPYRDTEDYLKHVIIQGAVDEDAKKPNPVEYCWMWGSNISELGCNYDYVKDFSNRSLSIKYPASNQSDHIYVIEGDDFGSDDFFSWRDGLGFYLYIDNIDALDLNHGYVYFGGYDITETHNPVIHKWNMTTLSGILKSGWNSLVLGMKYADEVEWTDLADKTNADPRILHNIILQKIGMVFKGKGDPITMYMNGFVIERSHFKEGGQFDTGLYLHGNDILKTNVGELDFHSGTLEFFIRPDWDLYGKDIYKEFRFRSLFHFGNVANDVLGASITPLGIEIYYGNLTENFTLFRITDLDFGVIDRIMHMAFVFSNDGTSISNDGSAIRVYVNNMLIAKSLTKWEVSDEKHFHFIFGGQSLLVQKMQGFIPKSSSVDGVVSNIKIYNYCKTDFRDSIRSADIEGRILLTKPSELIEISKDNVTFYRVGDVELPFYFNNILADEVVPVYVRTTIPNELAGKEKRTAELLGQWDIGI